jgi:hypothetical protein
MGWSREVAVTVSPRWRSRIAGPRTWCDSTRQTVNRKFSLRIATVVTELNRLWFAVERGAFVLTAQEYRKIAPKENDGLGTDSKRS